MVKGNKSTFYISYFQNNNCHKSIKLNYFFLNSKLLLFPIMGNTQSTEINYETPISKITTEQR